MERRTLKDLRVRKTFAKIDKIIDIPDLINIQRNSYEKLLQANLTPEKREEIGYKPFSRASFRLKTLIRPLSLSS